MVVLFGLWLVLALFMVPGLFPKEQAPILVMGFVGLVILGSVAFEGWRCKMVRVDARVIVGKRTPYLDSIILLGDLSPESFALLETSRTMGIRDDTAWAIATLLLENDQDREELSLYKKFLPSNPKEDEDPGNPLYEAMDKIQDRINTRMRAIATHVTGEVPAARQREDAL